MTNEIENNPMQAVDHLIHAFELSGMHTFTEAGPEETKFVTVRAHKKRADGTIGPVMRYVIESATGKIVSLQVL